MSCDAFAYDLAQEYMEKREKGISMVTNWVAEDGPPAK